MALSTFFLLVSCTSPPSMNSSNMKKAFSKLKMMSSSHTCGTGIANALKSTLKHCQHISKTVSKILSAQFQDSIQNTVSTVPTQYPKYCQHSSKTVSKIILKQLTVRTVQETSNVLSQLSITINIALTSLRQHQKYS